MITDHVVTLRGGPVDGNQYRVPIKLTQIVIAENRMSDMPAMGGEGTPQPPVKHLYDAATVVQGHTLIVEFFYRGVADETAV